MRATVIQLSLALLGLWLIHLDKPSQATPFIVGSLIVFALRNDNNK